MTPDVYIIMGSTSDWPVMQEASRALHTLEVSHQSLVVSAHRTPQRLYEFAGSLRERGAKVLIAGAGGAAHLPGMAAALTTVPVIGVPVTSSALQGVDSLLSIVQMPRGIPVATVAVGAAGAFNAGLLAAQMLAGHDQDLAQRVEQWRRSQTEAVPWEVDT